MLAALLSSASLQEEKRGLQKDALSDGSSTKSTLYQDERETIPINTFWIHPVYCLVLLLGGSYLTYSGATRRVDSRVIWGKKALYAGKRIRCQQGDLFSLEEGLKGQVHS